MHQVSTAAIHLILKHKTNFTQLI